MTSIDMKQSATIKYQFRNEDHAHLYALILEMKQYGTLKYWYRNEITCLPWPATTLDVGHLKMDK